MLRVLVLALAILCFHAWNVHGRNETLHACELVIKCFDEAETELMKCQNILSIEPSALNSLSNDGIDANVTTPEPTTVAPADDCMAAVKVKMQQKRVLIEQRAQAFGLCLNERMGRGPEDVDPRKFRYCNTVISRYNARTTAPPDFTLGTASPSLPESPLPAQHRVNPGSSINSNSSTSTSAPTPTRKFSQQQLVTFSSSHARPSASQTATSRAPISSPHPPANNIRPRRQAGSSITELDSTQREVFAAAASSNGSNGDIIRPPGVSPPGPRQEITSSTESVTIAIKSSTVTSFEQQQGSTGAPQKPEVLPQQLIPDGPAGRISAIARFSSTGQASPDKNFVASRNATAGPSPSTQQSLSTEAAPEDRSTAKPHQESGNQTRIGAPNVPQQPQDNAQTLTPIAVSSSSSVAPATAPAAVSSAAPINVIASSSSSVPTVLPSSPLSDIRQNTIPPRPRVNDSLGGTPVIIQQQEQAEPGIAVPLDQPLVDVPAQEVPGAPFPPSGPAPPAPPQGYTVRTPPTTASTTTTTTTTAAPTQSPNTIGSVDEKQRNRAENLRESRRRVSEFKACMARARIKREECKPMVNCCPDSVKCHLRYELSELHDQIHRLELEISEGRQACLEKKKVDDAIVDALDQIDEEDLVSDESIVSQQVF